MTIISRKQPNAQFVKASPVVTFVNLASSDKNTIPKVSDI